MMPPTNATACLALSQLCAVLAHGAVDVRFGPCVPQYPWEVLWISDSSYCAVNQVEAKVTELFQDTNKLTFKRLQRHPWGRRDGLDVAYAELRDKEGVSVGNQLAYTVECKRAAAEPWECKVADTKPITYFQGAPVEFRGMTEAEARRALTSFRQMPIDRLLQIDYPEESFSTEESRLYSQIAPMADAAPNEPLTVDYYTKWTSQVRTAVSFSSSFYSVSRGYDGLVYFGFGGHCSSVSVMMHDDNCGELVCELTAIGMAYSTC